MEMQNLFKSVFLTCTIACGSENIIKPFDEQKPIVVTMHGFQITLPEESFVALDDGDVFRFEGKEPIVYDLTIDFDYVDTGKHPWVTRPSTDDGTHPTFVHNVFGEDDGSWITVAAVLDSSTNKKFMIVLNAKTTDVNEAIAVFDNVLESFELL